MHSIIEDILWDEQRIAWHELKPEGLREWDVRNLLVNGQPMGIGTTSDGVFIPGPLFHSTPVR